MKRHPAATQAVVDLNVLPKEQRPADISPLAGAIVLALVLAVFAIYPVAHAAASQRQRADSANDKTRAAQRVLDARQISVTEHRGLTSEVEQATATLAKLTAAREQVQGGTRPLGEDLAALLRPDVAPPGVQITGVSGTDGGLRVDGRAPGPLDAIAFAARLTQAAGFPLAVLSTFAPAGSNGGQFSIAVTR